MLTIKINQRLSFQVSCLCYFPQKHTLGFQKILWNFLMNLLIVPELHALACYFTFINRYEPPKTSEIQLCARTVKLQKNFFPETATEPSCGSFNPAKFP